MAKILVIEDASESLGAKIGNKKIGSFGDISVFSIRSEKMIGVGEGGVIATNSDKIFDKIKLVASRNSPYRSKKDPYWKKYYTIGEGYNYLMPHLLGSIAKTQVERFKNEILRDKIRVGKFIEKFSSIRKLNFLKNFKDHYPVYWLNSICFETMSIKK